MKISFICEFVTLTRVLDFQKAAEQMGISQATLSEHIDTLEKDIGYRLFRGTPCSVQLTEAGEEFIPYAKSIAELYGKLIAELESERVKDN